jgi:hypothetical protein
VVDWGGFIVEEFDMTRPAVPRDPLPQAGDSLRERLNDVAYGTAMCWMVVVVVMGIWTGLEWWQYLFHVPVTLGSTLMMTGVTVVVAWVKVGRAFREMRALKAGLGESWGIM